MRLALYPSSEPVDPATVPAEDLSTALLETEIGATWEVARLIHAAADRPRLAASSPLPALLRKSRRDQGFQNLVVGRLAERVFRERHLAVLELDGFDILDLHERGENRDYAVQRDGLELPVNVKVASSLFRNARKVVGLDPEDCIPISTYKALSASERVPDLIYVDLVDFELREKIDAFMSSLEGDLAVLWELLSWYGGRGSRRAQDQYIGVLFDRRGEELLSLMPNVASYRAISAQRALAIMHANPRRVPGLGVPRAGRGGFNAEVNVHISVRAETVPWDAVAETLRREGIRPLLERIRRTERRVLPAPAL